jgi:hypothetical protein
VEFIEQYTHFFFYRIFSEENNVPIIFPIPGTVTVTDLATTDDLPLPDYEIQQDIESFPLTAEDIEELTQFPESEEEKEQRRIYSNEESNYQNGLI